MRHAWRAATAVCLLAVAALSTSSTSLGTPAQAIACFGLAPTIVGSEGSDDLFGTEGNDVIAGLGGNDFIAGLGGDDALCGGPGNDSFVPGPGNDRVDGGGGGVGVGFIELVALSFAPGPVSADLSAGTATGEGSDTLVNVSGLIGGPYGDSLTGNGGVNAIFPGGGDDVVDGRGGDDFVGFDLGVQASLVTGSALGEGSDRLVSVEQLSGSDFADVLIGDNGRNYLAGGDGNDLVDGRGGADRVFGDNHDDRVLGGSGDDIVGGDDATDRVLGGDGNDKLLPGAGSDVLVGGKGFDVVSFVRSTTGIKASLLVGRATGQGIDELATVESIDGSQQRDEMIGDGKTNFLFGNSGTDRIKGFAAADFLEGGARTSSLEGGGGRDYCLTGAGASRCEITGTPQIPSISDKPPAARMLSGESAVNRGPGIVMTMPPGLRSRVSALTRYRTSALGVFGARDFEGASGSGGWSFASPLLRLFESAATAGPRSFRYSGQPSCFAERKPYRTTIAPPEQVEPAVPDGAREQVFWRGLLFRHGPGGKLARFRATPWLTAVVQGAPVPTGFPVWTNTAQSSFAGSQSFAVPPGTYTWAGVLTWVRTGHRVQKHIAPHIVHAGGTKPDKSCTFR